MDFHGIFFLKMQNYGKPRLCSLPNDTPLCPLLRTMLWSMKLSAAILESGSPGSPVPSLLPALTEYGLCGKPEGMCPRFWESPLAGSQCGSRTPVSQVRWLHGEEKKTASAEPCPTTTRH